MYLLEFENELKWHVFVEITCKADDDMQHEKWDM